METLRQWIKATLFCRGVDDFNKAAHPWDKERRASVAKILAEIRTQGFYPDKINENGEIVWGVALENAIQVKMKRHADWYFSRGQEVRENGFLIKNME